MEEEGEREEDLRKLRDIITLSYNRGKLSYVFKFHVIR